MHTTTSRNSTMILVFFVVLICSVLLIVSCPTESDPIVITVTFDAQGGENLNPTTKIYTYGLQYGSLAYVSKDGYVLSGWTTKPNGSGDVVTEETEVSIPSDHTLYANWVPNTITVRFSSEGEVVPEPSSKTVVFGEAYGELPTVSRTGFRFVGWRTYIDGIDTIITSESIVSRTEEHFLHAIWKQTPKINFDSQGGSSPIPASIIVESGERYDVLATTTKDGYRFDGWFTSPKAGVGDLITSNSIVYTNQYEPEQTLYAKWTPTPTVTFDAQGGDTPCPSSNTYAYGEAFGDLATTSRDKFAFDGWWTEPEGKGLEITASDELTWTTDFTLYAKWIFPVSEGPAGGLVFYENPNYLSDGWRYLESAPEGWYEHPDDPDNHTDPWVIYGYYREDGGPQELIDVEEGIGAGKPNTQALVEAMGDTAYLEGLGTSDDPNLETTSLYAANLCSQYTGGGYDDWFLPSKDELYAMYENLHESDFGGFLNYGIYWSSSRDTVYFSTGDIDWSQVGEKHYIRPIRSY